MAMVHLRLIINIELLSLKVSFIKKECQLTASTGGIVIARRLFQPTKQSYNDRYLANALRLLRSSQWREFYEFLSMIACRRTYFDTMCGVSTSSTWQTSRETNLKDCFTLALLPQPFSSQWRLCNGSPPRLPTSDPGLRTKDSRLKRLLHPCASPLPSVRNDDYRVGLAPRLPTSDSGLRTKDYWLKRLLHHCASPTLQFAMTIMEWAGAQTSDPGLRTSD